MPQSLQTKPRQYTVIDLGKQLRLTLKPRTPEEEEKLRLLSDADLGFIGALASPDLLQKGGGDLKHLEQQWLQGSSLLGHIASAQTGLPSFERQDQDPLAASRTARTAEAMGATHRAADATLAPVDTFQALQDITRPWGKGVPDALTRMAKSPTTAAGVTGFASGVTSNLIPPVRRAALEAMSASPEAEKAGGYGQLAGMLTQVGASLPIGAAATASRVGARYLPEAIAKLAPYGATMGAISGSQEAGRLELQEDATGQPVPLERKVGGIAGQTALGTVLGMTPAAVGGKIANPVARALTQAGSGAAIGAGGNAAGVAISQAASGLPVDLTTPDALRAIKFGGTMGLGMGGGAALLDAPWGALGGPRKGVNVPEGSTPQPTAAPSPDPSTATFWDDLPPGAEPQVVNVGGMAEGFVSFDGIRGMGRTVDGREVILDQAKWDKWQQLLKKKVPPTVTGQTPEGHATLSNGRVQLNAAAAGEQPYLPLQVDPLPPKAPELPADGAQLRLFEGSRRQVGPEPQEVQLPLPFDDPRSVESQLSFDFTPQLRPIAPGGRQPIQPLLQFGEAERIPFSGGSAIGSVPLRELSTSSAGPMLRKWGLLEGVNQGKLKTNASLAAQMAEIDNLWMGRKGNTLRLSKVVPGGPEAPANAADAAELTFLSKGRNLNAYIQLSPGRTLGDVDVKLYPPEAAETFPTALHPDYVKEAQIALDNAKQAHVASPSPDNLQRLHEALAARYGYPVLQQIPETQQIAAAFITSATEGARAVHFTTDPGASLRAYLAQWGKVPFTRTPGGGVRVPISARMREDLTALAVGGVAVASEEADPDIQVDDDLSLSVLGIPVPRANRGLLRMFAQAIRMKDAWKDAAAGAAVGGVAAGPVGAAGGAIVGTMAGSALRRMRTAPDPLWLKLEGIAKTHPEVAATVRHNPVNAPASTPAEILASAHATVKAAVQDVAADLRGNSARPPVMTMDGLWTFNSLRELGEPYKDAVIYLQRYMRQRQDIPDLIMGLQTATIGHLRNASEMRLFEEYIITARRVENYRRALAAGMQDIKIEQPPSHLPADVIGKGVVTPTELLAYHQALERELLQLPSVQAAVASHQKLMRNIGIELAKRKFLDIENVLDQPYYNREIMLRNVVQVDPKTKKVTGILLPQGSRRPIRLSQQGWAKKWQGHESETLHDSGEVTSRYLFETFGDLFKDDTVRDLAARFEQKAFTARYGQDAVDAAGGYMDFTWKTGRPPIQLPVAVVMELIRRFDAVPIPVNVINRMTSTLKAWLINGTGLGYPTRNFFGDTTHMLETTPAFGKGHVGGWLAILKAAEEVYEGAPETRQLLAEGWEEGLGVGAATANIAEHTIRHPTLQTLTIRPSDSLVKKATVGALEPLRAFQYLRDEVRVAMERQPRQILFIKTMKDLQRRDGNLGKPWTKAQIQEAAHATDQTMVAYSDQTDFQRQFIAGIVFPFFSWTGKQMQNRIPFMLRNGETHMQSLDRTTRTMLRSVLAIGVPLALWNELVTPEVEEHMDPVWRSQPHLNIPLGDYDGDGSENYLQLSMSGPANAIGMLTGTANPAARAIDLLVGRQGLWDTTGGESFRQIQEQWLSMANPLLTVPTGIALNKDVRTGRPLVDENLPWKERIWGYFRYLVTQVPPFSHANRAARTGESGGESLKDFIQRITISSIARNVEMKDLILKSDQRLLIKAMAEGAQEHLQQDIAARYGDGRVGAVLRKDGPNLTLAPVPTVNLLRELGPSTTWLYYHFVTKDKPQFKAWNSAVSALAQQLSKESGGQAEDPGDDGVSWDHVARMVQMSQQNPPWYVVPKIQEAQEKRKRNLRGWLGWEEKK